jgi:hypothetical protein
LGGPDGIHPDVLRKKLSYLQICGWIAWMCREPRGARRLDVLSALAVANLRAVWIENDAPPETFLPKFADARAATSDPETNALIDDLFSGLQLNMRGFFE